MDKYTLRSATRTKRKQTLPVQDRIADTLDDIADALEDILKAIENSGARR